MGATIAATSAWEWRAMGTTWRIHHAGGVDAAAAAAAAELVEADEARWSRFRPGSEVSQLTAAAGRPTLPSPETLAVLEACVGWTHETGGAFQPLVGAALAGWGYRASWLERRPHIDHPPAPAPVEQRLRVDRRRGTVLVPAGTVLDLGGIGKSWCARRVAALLAPRTSGDLLIDAGGDILAVRGGHLVAIEGSGEHVWLEPGQAVATSGHGRRRWRTGEGSFAHHLIDPASGAPAVPAHVTVVAGDVVTADVLATALAVRPALLDARAEACRWTPEHGQSRATAAWPEVCR